jgi:glucuronate isomerase
VPIAPAALAIFFAADPNARAGSHFGRSAPPAGRIDGGNRCRTGPAAVCNSCPPLVRQTHGQPHIVPSGGTPMLHDPLTRTLFDELRRIPLLDPHSHIDPFAPTARSLDDLLGYHYYTELAHSAGMDQAPLRPEVDPRERCRAILAHMDRFDNTAQYGWFVEIVNNFLGLELEAVTAADADRLFDAAKGVFSRPDWEAEVFRRSNLEKIFLTNNFDDRLDGFDTSKYVPCLRTDDLVFHLDKPEVRQRLAKVTGIEVGDAATEWKAMGVLFERFVKAGAKACAISLPPNFDPQSSRLFIRLAHLCCEYHLPFDLMIGVNRRVYENGVYQGQDLFDQRTSLIQYAWLFNSLPEVTFCVSVLSSSQNQELVSYSWIFPNVVTSGHWWYSNIPAYIEPDLRARLGAVPKAKQLGYYSDAYKLEFVLPKFDMYRRILAKVLAEDFVKPGRLTEAKAVDLGRTLLRDNVSRIFGV